MPETYENAAKSRGRSRFKECCSRLLARGDRALHRDKCDAWCIVGTRGIDDVCTSTWGELIDEVSDEMREGNTRRGRCALLT
jgi:hypothetical protein